MSTEGVKKARGLDEDDHDDSVTIVTRRGQLEVDRKILTNAFPYMQILLEQCKDPIARICFDAKDTDPGSLCLAESVNPAAFYVLMQMLVGGTNITFDGVSLCSDIAPLLDYLHASALAYGPVRDMLMKLWKNAGKLSEDARINVLYDIYEFLEHTKARGRFEEFAVDYEVTQRVFRIKPTFPDNPMSVVGFVRKISTLSDLALVSARCLFGKPIDVESKLADIGGPFMSSLFRDFKEGYVVAGGGVVYAGCPTPFEKYPGMDVDIFVLSGETQKDLVRRLSERLFAMDYVVGTMGKSVLVAVRDGHTVQLICSSCSSRVEVLAGFDMDYVQCLVTPDGQDVLLTTSCAESWITQKANASNTGRKLTLPRLAKAHLKGFEIKHIPLALVDTAFEAKSIPELFGVQTVAGIADSEIAGRIKAKTVLRTTENPLYYSKNLLKILFKAKAVAIASDVDLTPLESWHLYGGRFGVSRIYLDKGTRRRFLPGVRAMGRFHTEGSLMMISTCPLYVPFDPNAFQPESQLKRIVGELFREIEGKKMGKWTEASKKTYRQLRQVHEAVLKAYNTEKPTKEQAIMTLVSEKEFRGGRTMTFCDVRGKVDQNTKWFDNHNVEMTTPPSSISGGQWVKLLLRPTHYCVTKKIHMEKPHLYISWQIHRVTVFPRYYFGARRDHF